MRLHFKCSIDVNSREEIPEILNEIIGKIEDTEMYQNDHCYELYAYGHYKSEWCIKEHKKAEEMDHDN